MTSAAKFNRAICAAAEHVARRCTSQDTATRTSYFVAFFRGYVETTASVEALKALDDVLNRPKTATAPTEDNASGATC